MKQKMEILVNEELLRNRLLGCREICPTLLDLFTWRKDYYPGILAGIVTFIFGLFWYLEPPVIVALAVFGLIVTISDFVIPLISKAFNPGAGADVGKNNHWSSEKEKKFSIFVNRIAYYSVQIWNAYVSIEEFKKERPNSYSACVIVSLLFLAWIGSAINNLFLAYILVLFLVLLPGLLHRRIIQGSLQSILKRKSN